MIHFQTGDDRFCGTKQKYRQFTTEETDVTCPNCKANDTLEITKQGELYLNSLGFFAPKW